MKVVIVSNGDLNYGEGLKAQLSDLDVVICCDGGIRHLKTLGLEPDFILGDFDSVSEKLLDQYREEGVPILTYPKVKNETDTELAVQKATELGASQVIILGGLGTRWDHSFANIMVLIRLFKQGVKSMILDNNNQIQVSDKLFSLTGKKGQILSLLPLGDDVTIFSTKGLKYPIINKKMPLDTPYGISNVFIEERVEIQIKSGWLLAVLAED